MAGKRGFAMVTTRFGFNGVTTGLSGVELKDCDDIMFCTFPPHVLTNRGVNRYLCLSVRDPAAGQAMSRTREQEYHVTFDPRWWERTLGRPPGETQSAARSARRVLPRM